MFFLQEETWDVVLHTTTAYIALGIGVPVAFAAISRASGNRWACTISAAIYTVFVLARDPDSAPGACDAEAWASFLSR